VQAAGAVDPAAAGAGVVTICRSTIAGVLTTAGWADTGAGRSMMRVHPTSAALDARTNASVAFMLFLLKKLSP